MRIVPGFFRSMAVVAAVWLLTWPVSGQEWQWAFQTGGGGRGASLARDSAGDVYVTGYFWSPTITLGSTTLTNFGTNTPDIFLVKCTPSGQVLWAQRVGGAGDEWGPSVAVDTSGQVYVAGNFSSPVMAFDSLTLTNRGTNTTDIFIAQYDLSGHLNWLRQAGGNANDQVNALAVDANGNVVLTGGLQSTRATFGSLVVTNASQFGFFIAKYNSLGEAVWAGQARAGDIGAGSSVAVDLDGNLCVTGWFSSTTMTLGNVGLINRGSFDIFIAKYTPQGNVLWGKRGGGAGNDGPAGVAVDGGGNVLVCGDFASPTAVFDQVTVTNSSSTNSDLFITKYSPSGQVLWAKAAGGGGGDVARRVAVGTNNQVYVTGYFSSPTLTLGGITLTNYGYNSLLYADLFVASYSAIGDVLWAARAGGVDFDLGEALVADEWGNVYVTGSFRGYSYFDSTRLNYTGDEDGFVAKYSPITPSILVQPQSVIPDQGQTVSFTVSATGPRPLTYQWRKNGVPLAGETNTTLVMSNVTTNDNGVYTAVASDFISWAVSDTAGLAVVPPAHLLIAVTNGQAIITLQGTTSLTYEIHSTSVLPASNQWRGLTTLTLTNVTQTWTDPELADQSGRFYRSVRRP